MLKYKLNIKDKQDKVIDVKYESLYLSLDGSTITGVTDTSYGLSELQTITVVTNEPIKCSLSARDVMCCGYVIYNRKFHIEDFGDTIGILYSDGQYYCVNKDDYPKKIKFSESVILSEINSGYTNPFITVNNYEYEIGQWNEKGLIDWKSEIIIPNQYWVYDNKIIIDDITYDVIIDNKNQMINTDEYYPYIILNDMSLNDMERILYVIDWEYNKRKKVTLFEIFNINKPLLHIEEIHCIKQNQYFDLIDNDGNVIRRYAEDYPQQDDFLSAMVEANVQQVSFEWKKVQKSDVIDLYVTENINDFAQNARIFISPINNGQITLKGKKKGEDIIFSYYNRIYTLNLINCINKEYLLINGVEYEIYEYEETKYIDGDEQKNIIYYILYNNMPLKIEKKQSNDDNNSQAYIKNNFKIDSSQSYIYFDIKKYKLLNIENIFYKVEENNDEYYCHINALRPFQLQIINKFGNNVLRCIGLNEGDISDLFQTMSSSPNDFICEVITPIFDTSLVSPLDKETKDYVTSDIVLQIHYNSFLLPIKLEREIAINAHKDYITHNNFMEEQTQGVINRIVDMEKDIYYPAYAEEKGNELVMTLCNQIQFDLHFRSRDLKTWVINDENKNVDYINYPTSWNLFDKYRYSNDDAKHKEFYPILNLKGDNQFFPPSDLLYFLNFTNEDVFYQKQKIGKSFLRLSFYDSPDPKKQNLLHMSTIFMSETHLYQKYINADKIFSKYITIKDRGYSRDSVIKKDDYDYDIETVYSVSNNNVVSHIGVDTEPCENNKKNILTFDENKRLSSSFIIKNRNSTADSCEGFYLYLFKEYSNGLHERSIYMRVQFNHAGLGKTVNFMQLYHQNADKSKAMLNWSSKFNYEKYKDGCTLQELYEHLYIEIKVKYDIKNKRFCYYLPQWMSIKNSDKHTMRLSLFEVKLKDESK